VGGVGPSDRVQVGVALRIGLGGGYQATPIVLVDRHLLGQQEARAQPRGLGAEGEHRGDAASVADPAGRDHRYGRDGVDHRWHQRKRCDAPRHVAARLPSLRDDHVDTASHGAPCLLGAADRVHDEPSGVVHRVDIAPGVAPEERHDPQARRECLIDAAVLIEGENEVPGKRPVGERSGLTDHLSGVIGPPQPQRAEATGIRDRGGQAGIDRQRRLDDRVFNAEQLAHRRA